MVTMGHILLCPHCRKRLPVRIVSGIVIVYCRYCKQEITLSAEDAA